MLYYIILYYIIFLYFIVFYIFVFYIILYYIIVAPTTITNAHIKLHDSEKGSTSDRACVPPQKVFRPGLLITVNCTGPKETRLANKIILENGVGEISLGICEVEVYGELAFFK